MHGLKTHLKNTLFGAVIGAAMLIPGVSGGTTAIILGIYDRLVSAVGSIFKTMRESLRLLVPVALGGALGVLLFAKPLLKLTELWFVPAMGVFLGAVAGSLPLLLGKTGAGRGKKGLLTVAAFVLAGGALAFSMTFLPEGLFAAQGRSFSGFLFIAGAGAVLAAALVLPGISFSHMLLVLGMHSRLLSSLTREGFDLYFLSALALGVLGGTLLCTRLLESAMARFPRGTFALVTGFVLASVAEVFTREILPRSPGAGEYALFFALFAAAAVAVWGISRRLGPKG